MGCDFLSLNQILNQIDFELGVLHMSLSKQAFLFTLYTREDIVIVYYLLTNMHISSI